MNSPQSRQKSAGSTLHSGILAVLFACFLLILVAAEAIAATSLSLQTEPLQTEPLQTESLPEIASGRRIVLSLATSLWRDYRTELAVIGVSFVLLLIMLIALIALLQKFRRSQRRLAALNADLERQVKERTAALSQVIVKAEQNAANLSDYAARLRSYFETPLIGIAITSPEKGWLEVNDSMRQMLGYTMEEMQSSTWADFTHPDDLAPDVANFNRLLAGEADAYTLEKRFIRKDGAIIWTDMAVNCIRKPDRSVDYIVAVLQDITERKRAEDALRRSEAQYRLLAENMDDVVWTMNAELQFTYVSPSVERLRGYTAQEVMAQSPMEALTPSSQHVMRDAIEHLMLLLEQGVLLQDSQPVYYELEQPCKDGSIIWTETAVKLLFDSNGAFSGFIGLSRNMTERKRAQETLNETRDYLDSLITYASAPIIVWDPSFVITRFNRAFEELAGITADEAIGQSLDILFPAERRDDSMKLIYRALSGEHWETVEIPIFNRASGEIRTVLWNSANILAKDGQSVRATIAQGIDITETKQAEAALNENRLFLANLVENSGTSIFVKSFDGRYLLVNSKWEEFTGIPRVVGLGKTDAMLFAPPAAQQNRRVDLVVMESGEVHQEEEAVNSDQGQRLFLTVKFPIRDKNGAVNGVCGITTEITERKRAEEQLRATRDYLDSLITYASAPIIVWDPSFTITRFNHAFQELAGIPADEAVGQHLDMLFPTERRDDIMAIIRRTLSGEQWETVEIPILNRITGAVKTVLWNSANVLANDGCTLQATIAQGIDITERKQADEALRAANQQLAETNTALQEAIARANELAERAEAANIAKSEFLANMSHEIRTPMNGVIGMIGLLLDTQLSDEQRRYADTARSSAESLLTVINDILDFSKIEAGKLDMEVFDFDLQSLLDDFASTIAFRAQEKGLELLCCADPNVPTLLRGDPGRLRQVLTNLTGNAIKFTEGGEVVIRVSISAVTDRNVLLHFEVRDTGIGIPREKLGLLFNKFSQVDASSRRRYGGTGLGLAISKQLAEMMGGAIGVESVEGVGSRFWFTARFERQPDGVPFEQQAPADLRDVHVLIVDDNATNREILHKRLAAWGMRPVEASDGPTAILLLRAAVENDDPFALALLDMQMPGMDGESLGRVIKTDPQLQSTQLAVMTSMVTSDAVHRLDAVGFSAYLTKPLQQHELRHVLSAVMRNSLQSAHVEQDATMRHGLERHVGRVLPHSTATPGALRPERFMGLNARILLAEDNITNQKVALGILKRLGLRADAVADGAEAIHALTSIPYDLVLMDVQMPVMDGLEATAVIRDPSSTVLNHAIPIIAMTAEAMHGDRERCLAAGMNDYLSKPVTPQSLADRLVEWLQPENSAVGTVDL